MKEDETSPNGGETLNAAALRDGAARLGIGLDDAKLETFREFYRAIREWNARINLTSDADWETMLERHFLESLSLVEALPDGSADGATFVDIGSGAGLPGIPFAIAFPNARGVLVDARAKKAEFLESAIRRLDLGNLSAVHGRAETLGRQADMRERFDFVFARAVAKMPVLAEFALPFCRVGGRVAVHKTESADADLRAAERAVSEMGGSGIVRVRPTVGGRDSRRIFAVIDKTGHTPRRYPRNPGIPAKRPVGVPRAAPRSHSR